MVGEKGGQGTHLNSQGSTNFFSGPQFGVGGLFSGQRVTIDIGVVAQTGQEMRVDCVLLQGGRRAVLPHPDQILGAHHHVHTRDGDVGADILGRTGGRSELPCGKLNTPPP